MQRNYFDALNEAIGRGVDFDIDFHAQSKGDVLAELAKAHGYRKPRDANGSTGRYFFQRLEREYQRAKTNR